jgi:hypothetical protein
MRKLALVCGAAALLVSAASAEAQVRYRHGWHGGWGYAPYAYRRGGWGSGGALAAGLIGGLALGGLAAAAASPYGYPPPPVYAYPYPPPVYGNPYPPPVYGYGYPRDPFAAPHEIRGGYRTVYRHGYGRVIVGPAY